MSRWCGRILMVSAVTLSVFNSVACFPDRLESSDRYAPIDMTDGQQVDRIIVDKSTMKISRLDYGWKSESGRTTWSDVVVEEIEQFLGQDTRSNLIQVSAASANWFWSPGIWQDSHYLLRGSDDPVFSRMDSIIILGINPTLALRIERPAQFFYDSSLPWHDPRPYWGWGRLVLSQGAADSVAIPVERCGESWPYVTEILIPSLDYRESIDLIRGGILEVGTWVIMWQCGDESPEGAMVVFNVEIKE